MGTGQLPWPVNARNPGLWRKPSSPVSFSKFTFTNYLSPLKVLKFLEHPPIYHLKEPISD